MAGIAEAAESREWFLTAYAPDGVPTSDHLKLRTVKLALDADSIPHQHVAVEALWVAVDPFIRFMMNGREDGLYFPQFDVNQVIKGFGLARVIRSTDDKFSEGDTVIESFLPIAEYSVIPTASLRKVDPKAEIALSDYLGPLGLPGFTAWVGIELIANPKPGSTVFISAAAGGVGMLAGQLAKFRSCRVIGSTGLDEKVKLLKELGYDDAFNYHKETDLDTALSRYFPNGIDVYLDNVGGKMLEAVLNHVNTGACIPLCGMISQYNKTWTEREGVRNLMNMVGKSVTMQGFLVSSYFDRFGEFTEKMETYMIDGKIKSQSTIYHGIESFLEAFASIFSSSNVGKVIIQVRP
ncbi:2-alkenal reductase (NADP(+)-dependent)-like isoform X1 [Diospyros lotus]|uniref:2-alkenal reductase (NADP(+)-dependent)-like isoform X1 n=1 Tax=Diospyros lotus TaxID=55363 RepID=UPI00225B8D7E|nr:2-alkenal reductase (NADP(+)-dependent)-like isoform X1 [Diospyros lotus]